MPKEITFDKFIRWAGVTLIVFAVLYITNYLSEVLLPFVIAWFFAYLLYPVVKFIENKLHIKVRALSIILAMGAAIAVIGGVLWLIIPPMIDQFDKLGEVLTRWLHQTTHTNNLTAMIKEWLQENQAQIEHFLKSKDFSDALKTTMPKLFSVVGQTANIIISIVASMITLLYMFFILLDYETLTANWVRIFPKKNRPFWQELMKDVERELNNYIRGQGMVALCMGIMFCIGFTIIGFPMAIGLGILIGIMDLVPYLHTFALIPTAFLLDGLRTCLPGILRGSGDYRYGGYAKDYGQGDGLEPSHPAAESLHLGCPAGLHRSDYRTTSHHPAHSLLATVCDERKAAIPNSRHSA